MIAPFQLWFVRNDVLWRALALISTTNVAAVCCYRMTHMVPLMIDSSHVGVAGDLSHVHRPRVDHQNHSFSRLYVIWIL